MGTDRKKGKKGEEEREGPGTALSNKLCGELQAALKNGRYWTVEKEVVFS